MPACTAWADGGDEPVLMAAEDGGNGQKDDKSQENEVTWGAAEFIAAEEMGRYRGYWWAPDGQLPAGRPGRQQRRARVVDGGPGRAGLPAPAPPLPGGRGRGRRGVALACWSHRRAGGPGARCGGTPSGYPYLAAVHWGAGGPPCSW